MKNVETLNIKFTSDEADNSEIWQAMSYWNNLTISELSDRLDVDCDCAELIKAYLVDQQAIAEGLNVKFWFN